MTCTIPSSSELLHLREDKEVFGAIIAEGLRQEHYIQLIASENTTWPEVMEVQGSIFTNKYAEGYPGRRYYGGCECADIVENLAIERVKKLFNCEYANVQPHSGSSANLAVFTAVLKPNDTIMGMGLSDGGHLTHGSKVSISGKFFNSVPYGVDIDSCLVNYDKVESLAMEHKPKLIIAGFSAYPRTINWKRFREIADKVGAILLVDMAHIAGLVAGGVIESPIPFADIVTSTTHKTLRGARGAIILSKDMQYAKALDSSVFPGTQGGPLMHAIAGKAVSFGLALRDDFKTYAKNILINAKALSDALLKHDIKLITGGTENHMVLIDLRGLNINGSQVESLLQSAGMVCNKNGIPGDPLPPKETSGIRLGSPAGTSRNFGTEEFTKIGEWIAKLITSASVHGVESEAIKTLAENTRRETLDLCKAFPVYKD